MKAINTLLAVLFITVSTVSFAGHGERLLKKKVSNAINYTTLKSEQKKETTVTAWITVDEKGEVKVTGMMTSNAEAAKAIKAQLEKISNLPVEELKGKTFAYKFVLRTEE